MSEHLETVRIERAKFGTPLGTQHAWDVSNATAYTWRHEGWGLCHKPAGNNWQGYSVDVILNVREQQAVDVLGDADGAGNPQWMVRDWSEAAYADLWRPPLPPDNPDPDPPPITNLEARVTQLERDVARMRDAMRDAGAALDSV